MPVSLCETGFFASKFDFENPAVGVPVLHISAGTCIMLQSQPKLSLDQLRRNPMKDIVLLYDGCCVYEIVILNYFLNFTGSQVQFCSLGQDTIRSMEGYSMNVDVHLEDVDLEHVRSFIVPGGTVKNIDRPLVLETLRTLAERGTLVAGICAGVDILDKSGILEGRRSTHSTEEDWVRDGNIITARANAYVDFAIETAKALGLFTDEQDLQETIDFWKHYRRMQ